MSLVPNVSLSSSSFVFDNAFSSLSLREMGEKLGVYLSLFIVKRLFIFYFIGLLCAWKTKLALVKKASRNLENW